MEWTAAGGYPLQEAAGLGRDDMVRVLVVKGIDVNSYSVDRGNRWTALHWAAQGNHVSTIKILLQLGADKTALGSWGPFYKGTPLEFAARRGNQAAVQVLSEA